MKYGIHINAKTKQVTAVTFDGFNGMKKLLGIDIAEAVGIGEGVTLWLDEEGRLKGGQDWFKLGGHLFAGSGMVDIGKLPTIADVFTIQQSVEFVGEETLDEDETEPEMGFIGSKEELDQAIASGRVSPALADFFN